MRKLFISIFLSFILALVAGIFLEQELNIYPYAEPVLDLTTIILSALGFSLVINFLFFYIRRWDGCIEKLGGATFSSLILFAAIFPFLVLWKNFPDSLHSYLIHVLLMVAVQIAGIGLVSTHFLRTKNFKPPKPGEPLTW